MCDVMSSVSMIIESITEWTSVGVMVEYLVYILPYIYTPGLDTTNCVLYKYVHVYELY